MLPKVSIGWLHRTSHDPRIAEVAFLDPFGANLEWSSIQKLTNTGSLFEVVVNFALNMAILRMLPNSGKVPDPWINTLDNYFGTREWFDAVYRKRYGGLFETEGVEKYPDYSGALATTLSRSAESSFWICLGPVPNSEYTQGAAVLFDVGWPPFERLGRRKLTF